MTADRPMTGEAPIDWSWAAADPEWIPPDVDADRASAARMLSGVVGDRRWS